jgi:outer membrane protein assembly factor BamB
MPRSAPLARLASASALLLLSAFSSGPAARADDWPQWRGPQRNGKSAETGLLKEWKEGGPPLAWQVSGLGGGFSSLAVTGGRIYTLGDLEGSQQVLALDAANGKLLWKTSIGPVWEDEYGGSRSTPTVDGGQVFVVSTEGDVVCLEAASGKKVWSRSLAKDFGGRMMVINGTHWKFSESPLVDGDRVIVTPGAKAAALVALDRKTGAEVWRAAMPDLGPKGADGAGYSSVVVSQGAGVKQYVQLVGRGLIGVDAATGKFLWGYNKVANDVANISTPIVDGDHVFAATGYGTGGALVELRKSGEGVAADEVYFLPADTFQNHHGGMVLDRGYVFAGSGHNKGFPVSIKLADGKLAWGPIRNQGQGSAAVTFADGHLYMRYQNGLVVLVEATPEGYREKGSFKIPGVNHPSWSHPVVAGGKLFVREQGSLYVYDLKAAG